MRELLCRDMGNECDEVIVGADDEQVLNNAAAHVTDQHPETDFGQAARDEVRLLIHDAYA